MPISNKLRNKRSSDCLSKSSNSGTSDKNRPTRKVASKKTPQKSHKDCKSCSAGVVNNYVKPAVNKPKKTTKSDVIISDKNVVNLTVIDYCKRCGDAIDEISNRNRKYVESYSPKDTLQLKVKPKTSVNKPVITSKPNFTLGKSTSRLHVISEVMKDFNDPKNKNDDPRNKNNDSRNKKYPQEVKQDKSIRLTKSNGRNFGQKPVQQYYKNENFRRTSVSSQEICKYMQRVSLLDPIKELPEITTAVENNDYTESETRPEDSETDNDIFIDPEDIDSLTKLKNFRQENYFECHSAKSRLKSASATSLGDHQCVYKFYLNDRLFPVPLNTDHHKTIRCSECYLPLDDNKETDPRHINGTIQTKVKLDPKNEVQDMVLMLPVKQSLIIREKRKEKQKVSDEVMYFGVIKLDTYGNSLFNPTLPADSLALKYQKGYKEYGSDPQENKYNRVNEGDVIVI